MRKVDTTSCFSFPHKKNNPPPHPKKRGERKKRKKKGGGNEIELNCTVFADKYYDIGK